MSGRLIKGAAAIAAALACAGAGPAIAAGGGEGLAGATVRDKRSGWSASVFVAHPNRARLSWGLDASVPTPSSVGATLSRRLSRSVSVSVDIFNVFDRRVSEVDYAAASRLWSQPGTPESFLVNPAEPRGFRLRLRKTF